MWSILACLRLSLGIIAFFLPGELRAEVSSRPITALSLQVGILQTPWEEAQQESYQNKLAHLERILLSVAGPHGADVVALQGVADKAAVESLVSAVNRALGPVQPSYVTWLVGDRSGADGLRAAVVSKFPLTSFRSFVPYPSAPPIIYVLLDARGSPLHLLVNAWGEGLGDAQQQGFSQQAYWCRRVAETILKDEPSARLLVMGDFGVPSDSPFVRYIERGATSGAQLLRCLSSEILPDSEIGAPSFEYTDHVFASTALQWPSNAHASPDERGGRAIRASGVPGEHPAVWVRVPAP